MAVLMLAEVTDGQLQVDATAKAVSAVSGLGDLTLLCCGATCSGAAEEAAKLDGVSKVLCAEHDVYGKRLAEPVADLLVSLAGDYSHIVAPATTDAKNIMPRVAALLDVMVISDVQEVVDGDTFVRPIYAGNAIQTVKSADATKVVTIRTATFDAAGMGGSASVETIDAAGNPELSSWVEDKVVESDRPELTSAKIV
ncbi:MAG: electron transfer flavoprotein subunit alpha/FixB family protein, partial [Pseudomonadota bacterium]